MRSVDDVRLAFSNAVPPTGHPARHSLAPTDSCLLSVMGSSVLRSHDFPAMAMLL
jgi:hypothetical protein